MTGYLQNENVYYNSTIFCVEKIISLCEKNPEANWSLCIEHIEHTRDYILRNGNVSLMAINMIIDIQKSMNGKNEKKFKLSEWLSI